MTDLLIRNLHTKSAGVEMLDEARVMPRFITRSRFAQFLFPVFASLHLWWIRFWYPGVRVISNGAYAAFYPADVVIMHGSAEGYVTAMQGRTGRMTGMRVMGFLEVWAMRLSRNVICVSDELRDYVVRRQGIAAAKCSVAYNGVELSWTDAVPRLAGPLMRLGFAGRLEYGKGVDYLLTLAEKMKAYANVRLVIAAIGDVPAALAHHPQVVLMRGLAADDMHHFYSQVDIFVLPSLFEGFELVTLEALAAGVPVLGRPIGACGLLLRRQVPWVAYLPEEPGVLLESLPSLLGSLRASLDGEAMRRYVQEHFSTSEFCSKVIATLRSQVS